MTSSDKTAKSQTQTISFEFDLQHPPRKVWRALTDPALLAEWLLPVIDHQLEPEAGFTFMAPPQPGWDGIVDCRYIEIEPHSKLRFTWVVGDPQTDFYIDTVVTFTLTPTGAGTRLNLEQSGFKPDQKRAFGGARYGWRMMGERLAELLGRIE